MTEKVKQYMEAKKKITKKDDLEKTNEVIKQLMEKAKLQKEQALAVKGLLENKFQPAPEFKEKETPTMQEKVNQNMEPNQIKIKIRGSERLRAADASYIKYHFPYLEGSPNEFTNQFDIHSDEKEWVHTVP